MIKKRKIVYVSGGRMDFGLMTPVLQTISKSEKLDLTLFYTGLHLMTKFGDSGKYVKKMFPTAIKINAFFLKDSPLGMARFADDLYGKLITRLNEIKPDITLTLGDRAEMLMVAIASVYLGIPTAQIHGGDKTFHVDEIVRHAITKLSHIHLTATDDSARRIEKMGEDKWRIHVVGAPGLDVIRNGKIPGEREIYKFINIKPEQKYILVSLHPVMSQINEAEMQIKITLNTVKKFKMPIVVIYPNADPASFKMIKFIDGEKRNPLFRIFANVEHEMFLGLAKYSACWITNSSAGRIESGSLSVPVVNLGLRQIGRPHGENVINTPFNKNVIAKSIEKCLNDRKFLRQVKRTVNPWGDGTTAQRIVSILENVPLNAKLLTKQITY